MHSRSAPQIGLNFEYVMWIFTRLSGLALYLLAANGLVAASLAVCLQA